MKVAINTRLYTRIKSGIHVYIKELCSRLADHNIEPEFHQYLDSPRLNGKTVLYEHIPKNLIGDMVFDTMVFGGVKTKSCDILHSPSFITPYKKNLPTILSIHDLAWVMYPEFYSKQLKLYLNHYLPISIKNADKIITISQNTKVDLIKYFNVEESKIKVTHLAVDHDFINHNLDSNLSHNPYEQYIFTLTTHPKRKNIDNLVRVWSADSNLSQYNLVIAGILSPEDIQYLSSLVKDERILPKLKIIGFQSNVELVNLYNRAICFVYPSYYEGFGLPIIEAMSAQTLVVHSNSSSMNQISYDTELTFDPNSIEEMRSKLRAAVEMDEKKRSSRIKLLKDHSRKYTWDRVTRETVNVYNSI